MNSKVKSYRDEPHISYSQISTYMACSLKYYFNYVAQIPSEFTPVALPFGSAIHEALACYYRGLKSYKEPYSLAAISEVFTNDWILRNEIDTKIQFDSGKGETKDTLLALGLAMLKSFYNTVKPGEVIAVETEFCLRKADNNGSKPLPLPIVGTIDLVERDSTGRVWAVDHKTASRKFTDTRIEDDLQLTIYTLAIARSKLANGDTAFNARFDLLTKTKNPEYVSYCTARIESDHKRLVKIVREILTAIDAGIFYPNPGWMCGSCQYQTTCQSW